MLIHPTDIPGLWDAVLPTGDAIRDLTQGQVLYLAFRNNWDVEVVR